MGVVDAEEPPCEARLVCRAGVLEEINGVSPYMLVTGLGVRWRQRKRRRASACNDSITATSFPGGALVIVFRRHFAALDVLITLLNALAKAELGLPGG